jgi:hypothetical protein
MGIEDAKEFSKDHAKEAFIVGSALGMALGAIALIKHGPKIRNFDLHEGVDGPNVAEPTDNS